MSVSIVVSFFNENKNIEKLSIEINNLKKKFKIDEVIFIDNGSKDNTPFKLKDICQKNNFIFLTNKDSKGYGDGYFKAIKKAKSEYILMNHSDLQFSFNYYKYFDDVINKDNYLISCFTKRKKRNFFSQLRTMILRIIATILLFRYIPEVNGQPKLFPKKIFDDIKFFPHSFSFDMFIYLLLRKHQIKIYWFDVVEKDRTEGVSSWSKGFKNQLFMLFNYLKEIKNSKNINNL